MAEHLARVIDAANKFLTNGKVNMLDPTIVNYYLTTLIDRGIEAAKGSYGESSDKHAKAMLRGSLEGFEACRNKSPNEIRALLLQAGEQIGRHLDGRDDESLDAYWRATCRWSEIHFLVQHLSLFEISEEPRPVITSTASS